MAPEQALEQRYGKRVDLWALGIIIFEMLTGKHPFYQKDDNEHTYKQRISSGSLQTYLNKFFEKYSISELA